MFIMGQIWGKLSLFEFRALQTDDLFDLFDWVNQDHVTHWYGHQPDFSQFSARYQGYIDAPDFEPLIVTLGSRPFGYLQYYDMKTHPNVLGLSTPFTGAGIDFFIGEKGMCGKGLGFSLLSQFIDEIFKSSNSERLLAGPHLENTRALWCLVRAGFRPIEHATTVNEGQLMTFERDSV